MNRMTTTELAGALSARRDNEVVARIDGAFVPVVGLRYESLPDLHVLELDTEGAEDAVLSSEAVRLLHAAMHTVWLHGDWFWLTRSMTTEEREAAAEAVQRHHLTLDDERELDDRSLRWWAPEYRYTARGVDTHRIAPGAEIEYERPGNDSRLTGFVHRRFPSSVSISPTKWSSPEDGAPINNILRVISSPVDTALARLDAHAAETSKES